MPEQMTDPTDMRRFSNALRIKTEGEIEAATTKLVDGDWNLRRWQFEMLRIVRRANIQQFVTSKGGNPSLVDKFQFHVVQINRELAKQWKHLRKFGMVIKAAAANGNALTFAQARARLYAKSTQAMFWRGAIPVELPQVPRDGQTICKTNCQCRLGVQKEFDADGSLVAVLVFWRLGIAEHCADCVRLAREWNPKRFEGDELRESGSMRQAVDLLLMDHPRMEGYRSELYEIFKEVA